MEDSKGRLGVGELLSRPTFSEKTMRQKPIPMDFAFSTAINILIERLEERLKTAEIRLDNQRQGGLMLTEIMQEYIAQQEALTKALTARIVLLEEAQGKADDEAFPSYDPRDKHEN